MAADMTQYDSVTQHPEADGAVISEGLQQREALAERAGVPAEGTLVERCRKKRVATNTIHSHD